MYYFNIFTFDSPPPPPTRTIVVDTIVTTNAHLYVTAYMSAYTYHSAGHRYNAVVLPVRNVHYRRDVLSL